jgi:integrase/recombinase XerD
MDRIGNSDTSPEFEENMRLVELYIVDLTEFQQMSKSSLRSYIPDIKSAARTFAELGVTFPDIRKNHLKQFVSIINERTERPNGLSHSRMKYIFTVLNSMIEFLIYEDLGEINAVPGFRKRYLKSYKANSSQSTPKQVPPTEKLSEMIYDIFDPKTRALHLLLAKTGIRREESLNLDLNSVNLVEKYILTNPATKRSNRKIPFDSECADAIERYLRSSSSYPRLDGETALFVNQNGKRCNKNTISRMINKPAEKHRLHDSTADRLEQHLKFGPHNYRHWFTTALRKNGCPERIIRILRGDAEGSVVDRYDHVTWEDIVEAYNACMPSIIST